MSRLPAHPLCPLFLSAFSACCVACGTIHSAVKLNAPHGYITLTFINYLCCITIIRSRPAAWWSVLTACAATLPSTAPEGAVAVYLLFAAGHSTVSCGHSGALLMLAAHKASSCRPRTLLILTAHKASCCRQKTLLMLAAHKASCCRPRTLLMLTAYKASCCRQLALTAQL